MLQRGWFMLCFLLLLGTRPAHATFHLTKIVEVFAGTPSAPDARYVVLQMYANGENLVNGHALYVFDRTGVQTAVFTFTADVANGGNQSKILIATPQAQTFFGVTADLTMAPSLLAAAGKICFDSTNIDCVAWGNYSRAGGDSSVGAPFSPWFGIASGRALRRRSDIAGNPTWLDVGDDTNNSANDFVLGLPTPANNAGVQGTIPPSTCGDGILQSLESCDDSNTTPGDGCGATCIDEFCGDGTSNDRNETCDDGNGASGDGCDNNCTVTSCGNGIKTGGEVCDDGNAISGDGCDSNCTATACGNGIKAGTENCDDGNAVSGDGCDSNCTATTCGNGIRTGAEVCDDGNAISGDGCDSNCTVTACGNGVRTGAESCDDGNLRSGDGCDANCTSTGCGNGIVTTGEACEPPSQGTCSATCQLRCIGDCSDTNLCTTNERCEVTTCIVDPTPTDDQNQCTVDSCSATAGVVHINVNNGTLCNRDQNDATRDLCLAGTCLPSVCGDGYLDAARGEQCDDNNVVNTDGCRNDCTIPRCGDGIPDGGNEACDDGNDVDTDSCRSNCTMPRCGDGQLDILSAEECDDGNADNLDACRNNCKIPSCGDNVLDVDEMCDDGNRLDADMCRNTCVIALCGDGIVDPGEQCDDKNWIETDGCRQCVLPRCGDGFVDTGEQCDDGNQVDTDGCRNACVRSACGDGVLDDNEQCDDGGRAAGDGCAADCVTEAEQSGCSSANILPGHPGQSILVVYGLGLLIAFGRKRRRAPAP